MSAFSRRSAQGRVGAAEQKPTPAHGAPGPYTDAVTVKEGFMRKRRKGAIWKTRWVVLQHAQVLYYKAPKDAAPRGIIPLDCALCVEIAHGKRGRPRLNIVSTYGHFQLGCQDEAELLQWHAALRTALRMRSSATPSRRMSEDMAQVRQRMMGAGKEKEGPQMLKQLLSLLYSSILSHFEFSYLEDFKASSIVRDRACMRHMQAAMRCVREDALPPAALLRPAKRPAPVAQPAGEERPPAQEFFWDVIQEEFFTDTSAETVLEDILGSRLTVKQREALDDDFEDTGTCLELSGKIALTLLCLCHFGSAGLPAGTVEVTARRLIDDFLVPLFPTWQRGLVAHDIVSHFQDGKLLYDTLANLSDDFEPKDHATLAEALSGFATHMTWRPFPHVPTALDFPSLQIILLCLSALSSPRSLPFAPDLAMADIVSRLEAAEERQDSNSSPARCAVAPPMLTTSSPTVLPPSQPVGTTALAPSGRDAEPPAAAEQCLQVGPRLGELPRTPQRERHKIGQHR